MAQNKLKYTGLTYDTIQAQITDLINSDTRFDKFRESSIAQTLIDVFTGTTDIVNYYLNRRAEECYFDTAQLKSSVISLSRMFGYVMNRKEPARAYIRLIIKGDIKDNQIQIPYYSKFSYGGDNYVLVNTLTYRFSNEDYNLMNSMKDDFTFVVDLDAFGKPIEVVQGDIKEKVFNGSTNAQVGAPFQIYKIEDESFSNVYGDKDFFHNNVTQVYVGENKTSPENRFKIDRRSLLNWEYIYNSDTLNKAQSVCLIRSTPDGFVEILFGDADINAENSALNSQATRGFSRKGALTRKDNIYVQYLSTKGVSSNKTGVIGDKINFSGKIYNSNGDDITSKITFELNSNIFGGADDESIDSIKYSSPKIYYSLDRLVSKEDYMAFLKSLTSPINVKNAIAWGEQEECDRYGKSAMVKMFNAVLFTVAGSLYDLKADPHVVKSGARYNEVTLDLNYNPYEFQIQGYFNIFIMQKMVNQLKQYATLTSFYEIDSYNFGETVGGRVILTDSDTTQSISSKTQIEIAEYIKSQILTNFPSGNASIEFTYGSDISEFVSYIDAPGKIELTNLNDETLTSQTGVQYLEALASKINESLVKFPDHRGNKVDNANFGNPAFIGRRDDVTQGNVFVWDSYETESNGSSYVFRLRFNELVLDEYNLESSPCYIKVFGDNLLLSILNLDLVSSFAVSETKYKTEINGKINNIINELNKRSQVSVKNIYVSPIIHRFNLVGTVYVKPLYDRIDVRRQVTNSLYEWLDLNADFNNPIHLSNIVEIIENNIGVVNANVRLQPEDITAGVKPYPYSGSRPLNLTKNNYYEPNPNISSIYRKYDGYGNILADIVNKALQGYVNSYRGSADISWFRFIKDGSNNTSYDVLERNTYQLANNISERTFYDDFARPLYETFVKLSKENSTVVCSDENSCKQSKNYTCCGKDNTTIPNYGKFIGLPQNVEESYNSDVIHSVVIKSDFAIIMEQIHKDLSYIIMENMLDSHGNIDAEYSNDGVYIRGGYSLGSEIVQINVDGVDRQNNLLLRFEYK